MGIREKTLCAIVLMSVISLPSICQEGLRPRGDVNGDWEVNIADVNQLVDDVLRGTPYDRFYTYALDLNGDEEINISDINWAINCILGEELRPMPSYSGTLPVLFIITDGMKDVTSKEEYISAKCWLDPMGVEGVEALGSAKSPLGLLIKGHGNYTWTDCVKKSFRLKFDKKQKVLGMAASRHWVIKANAFNWKGKIEDALPFEIGRRMGMSWNPCIEPIEVVLNGQYIGFYLLYEKIRVDKHRVNITEQGNGENDPANVTGGWLMEINNYSEPGNIVFTEGNGKPFFVMPHSPDSLGTLQQDYITTLLMDADRAIYDPDKLSREWERYIDIDSLAVYYLVQEVVDNPEAFSGSCFMHKERGDSTRLIFGPLWDCDHSFYRYSDDYDFDKFIYEDVPGNWYCRWIAEIAKFPHFQERVRWHWQHFYHDVYPEMDAFMDGWVSRIEQACDQDYVRWPNYSSNHNTARLNRYGKPSFHKKVQWLNEQWGAPMGE